MRRLITISDEILDHIVDSFQTENFTEHDIEFRIKDDEVPMIQHSIDRKNHSENSEFSDESEVLKDHKSWIFLGKHQNIENLKLSLISYHNQRKLAGFKIMSNRLQKNGEKYIFLE